MSARTDVTVRETWPLPQVSFRADAADAALIGRVGDALAAVPPTTPNTVVAAADGEGHVLWLGPDEWLIVAQEGAALEVAGAIETAIREAAGDAFLTAVDVSANRVGIEIAGPGAADLLASGCALDLERGLGAGSCAQTLIARANVVLWHVTDDPEPRYVVLVRPSFLRYLSAWLRDALEA
jgi:sarcosine oxidase, subunit gamma